MALTDVKVVVVSERWEMSTIAWPCAPPIQNAVITSGIKSTQKREDCAFTSREATLSKMTETQTLSVEIVCEVIENYEKSQNCIKATIDTNC